MLDILFAFNAGGPMRPFTLAITNLGAVTNLGAAAILVAILAAAPTGGARADGFRGPKPQAVADRYVPDPKVRVESWVTGLDTPWSLVFLPDGRALVSERDGRIRLIVNGKLRPKPYARLDGVASGSSGVFDFLVRLVVGGESGLMGLAVHPEFPRQPYIYAMHSYLSEGGRGEGGVKNRVIRLRHEGETARLDKVIIDNIPGARNHDGGRLGFGPDGMLYITTGEVFEAELAADLGSLAGKILRLDPDGGIPADNPFAGSPVYSYGHRNPQGLAWHPGTGALFASEHGPSGEFGFGAYDEVNVIKPGLNYGWPRVTGAPGDRRYQDPIAAWPNVTTPPAGMAFWRDGLFIATLGSEALLRLGVQGREGKWRVTSVERWFMARSGEARFGRLRDAVVGPDGALYVLTSNRDGRGDPQDGDDRILRIRPR
jgi:quinoprotein glucose dehydrogenase